ncbi:MAG: hypothetical protein Q9184_005264 [Pyrenodesmia sp. 2 TL-2023]
MPGDNTKRTNSSPFPPAPHKGSNHLTDASSGTGKGRIYLLIFWQHIFGVLLATPKRATVCRHLTKRKQPSNETNAAASCLCPLTIWHAMLTWGKAAGRTRVVPRPGTMADGVVATKSFVPGTIGKTMVPD